MVDVPLREPFSARSARMSSPRGPSSGAAETGPRRPPTSGVALVEERVPLGEADLGQPVGDVERGRVVVALGPEQLDVPADPQVVPLEDRPLERARQVVDGCGDAPRRRGPREARAVVRVLPGLLWTEAYRVSLIFSGLLFSAAHLLYLARFGPILSRPRIDGRPG